MLQKAKEREDKILEMMSNAEQPAAARGSGRLIETSPAKQIGGSVFSSRNTDLLVDIETDAPSPNGRVKYTETFSYAAAAAATPKTEQTVPVFNLLD
jgi:hypothetical protein